MTSPADQYKNAIAAFDAYNSNDPNTETVNGESVPKEIVYAMRMSERLTLFQPAAKETVKLAARCQHIGRWEILRNNYPMDKKGYLKWRADEKQHHAKIADKILTDAGYETEMINEVKSLLLKKELNSNPDTQLIEDVVCLVFIEHYLEEFAKKHDTKKIIDIIRKTAKKMSKGGLDAIPQLTLSSHIQSLLQRAMNPIPMFKFEEEFMEDDIRCIPMLVRFKLDKIGIKLKLSEWNTLTISQRTALALTEFTTPESLSDYQIMVSELVLANTQKPATVMPIEDNPLWSILDKLHEPLLEKLKEFHWTISLDQWKNLTDLQRFALIKLSRPSHKNKNFPSAMKEFGLAH